LAPSGVNIRSGPGTNFSIIGIAPQGTEGEIIGVSEDGSWWVASVPTSPNGLGWVAAAYVEAMNAENVPTVPTPPVFEFVQAPAEAPVQAPDELPANSLIVFSASRVLREGNRAYDLEDVYTVPAQPGSTPTLVLQNAMQPAFSASANTLAFRSTQSDRLGLNGFPFAVDQRVRYSPHKEDSRPRWSPTGDRFVFSSNRTGDRRWHVYLTRPTAGDDRLGFPEVTDLGFGKDADWHPSQDQIIFKGCDETGQNCGLWTMNADGSGRTRVADGFNDSLPRYSRDGQSVVFMSDSRDGNWELYTLSLADGAVTRITDNPAADGLPAWSPDGTRIAFMSNRDGAWGIWIVPATGGEAQLVTQLEEQLPDWLIQGIDWPR
jgi:Tol biopolymer transport system component